MKLSDALNSIRPTRGATTVIAAVMTDPLPLLPDNSKPASLAEARERLKPPKNSNVNVIRTLNIGRTKETFPIGKLSATYSRLSRSPDRNRFLIPYDPTQTLTVMERCAGQVRWGERVLKAAKANASLAI